MDEAVRRTDDGNSAGKGNEGDKREIPNIRIPANENFIINY